MEIIIAGIVLAAVVAAIPITVMLADAVASSMKKDLIWEYYLLGGTDDVVSWRCSRGEKLALRVLRSCPNWYVAIVHRMVRAGYPNTWEDWHSMDYDNNVKEV